MRTFFKKNWKKFERELFLVCFVLAPLISISPFVPGAKSVLAASGPVGTIGPSGDPGPIGEQGPVALQNNESALSNSLTGTNSNNSNIIDTENNLAADQSNSATTENMTDATLNSGRNDVSQNTSVGDVETGNIDAANNFINVANSSFAPGSEVSAVTLDGNNLSNLVLGSSEPDIIIPFPSGATDLENNITGSQSDNYNLISKNNAITFLWDNFSDTNNTIDVDANTGLNTITENTIVGDISTGNINLANSLINLQNFINPEMILNLGIITVLNGLTGDIVPSSYITGSDSENSNLVDQNTNVLLNIDNDATATNNANYDVNTGSNLISNNTAIGDVSTGDTNVENRVFNWLNPSDLVLNVINVFGKWVGSFLPGLTGNYVINQSEADPIYYSASRTGELLNPGINTTTELGNQWTGPGSENTNQIDNNLDVLANVDQTAEANNVFKVTANTGKNKVQNNTTVGNISTGSINIFNNIVNVLNNFGSKAGQLKLNFINIFGNWIGNLGKKEPEVTSNEEPIEQNLPEEEVLGEVYLGETLPAAGNDYPIYLYLAVSAIFLIIFEQIKFCRNKKR